MRITPLKNLILSFLAILIFTQGLIFIHTSKFEKEEFDRICNSLYTEKVWIDKCYFPYNKEIKTLNLARNLEIAGITISGACLFYFQKFHLKN